MFLNESIIEDTALAWLKGLGWSVARGPGITPGEPGNEHFMDTVV